MRYKHLTVLLLITLAGCATGPQNSREDCYEDYTEDWTGRATCYKEVAKKKRNAWTGTDTAFFVAYVVAAAADAHTTAHFKRYGFVEGNRLVRNAIGAQPDSSDVWQGFATVAITNYLIGKYLLPKGWRRAYYTGFALGHGLAFKHNCDQFRERGFSCL